MDRDHKTIGIFMSIFSIIFILYGYTIFEEPCRDIDNFFGENVCIEPILLLDFALFGLIIGFIVGMLLVSFLDINTTIKEIDSTVKSDKSFDERYPLKEKKKSFRIEESLTSKIEREKREFIEQSNKEELLDTDLVEVEMPVEKGPIEDEIQLQKFAEHPGWLWDPLKAKWIPEGDALPENPPPPASWSLK